MARGSSQATGAATQAQSNSNTLMSNAGGLYSALAPELMSEAAHPAGMAPADMAAAGTAAQQSAGGSMAGATGQGALLAARTRNAGAPAAAIGAAARGAGEDLSKRAVDTQLANASMKEKQRQGALSGMQSLTGMETGAGNQALGQVAGDVNANTGAENASWDWASHLFQPLLGAASASAPTLYKAFGG